MYTHSDLFGVHLTDINVADFNVSVGELLTEGTVCVAVDWHLLRLAQDGRAVRVPAAAQLTTQSTNYQGKQAQRAREEMSLSKIIFYYLLVYTK